MNSFHLRYRWSSANTLTMESLYPLDDKNFTLFLPIVSRERGALPAKFHGGRGECSPLTARVLYTLDAYITALLLPLQCARGTACPYVNTPQPSLRSLLPLGRCCLARCCKYSKCGPSSRYRDICHHPPFLAEAFISICLKIALGGTLVQNC